MNPIYNISENINICDGSNYTFPDGTIQNNITSPVSYVSTLTSIDGCDSIITTNIIIDPVYNISENINICDGDNHTFPDGTTQNNITLPITHISNLSTINGCDSIITTNILIDPIYSINQNVEICDGSNYTFPDGTTQNNITSQTTHISNLSTINGCDSIITTSLDVFMSYTSTTNNIICSGSDYTFADGTTQNNITLPVSYVSTLISIDGCDSLVTENLSINPVYNLVDNIDQCPGLDFVFPDGTSISDINSDISYVSTLTSIDGCDSIITTNINIYNLPLMDITFGQSGCPDLDMLITNNTIGTGCNWSVSGPGWLRNYDGCNSISDTYFNPGSYDVTLSMVSVDGCPMDTTVVNAFEVYPSPLAQFSWSPSEGNILTNNTIDFTNSSVGGSNYDWLFGDGDHSNNISESHTYKDTGHFPIQLVVSNDYGCSDTANGLVIIHDEFFIYVPNSFTPDNDMYNNTFKPIISGHDSQSYTLYIFNRWGEILFESHDTEVGWDGNYRGKMSMGGVYVWKIEVTTNRNVKKSYMGHVTLIK